MLQNIFLKKNYSYALFFGHLAVEKIIKAILVKNTNQQGPRSHNLLRLAQEANIKTTEEQKRTLIRITAFATIISEKMPKFFWALP